MSFEQYADKLGSWESTTSTTKKPTLNQFLRKVGKKKLPEEHLVFLIWCPGEFDNFTLETELFRIILRGNHAFYSVLDAFTSDPSTSEQALAVKLGDRSKGEFTLSLSTEKGSWNEVGSNGHKWKSQ